MPDPLTPGLGNLHYGLARSTLCGVSTFHGPRYGCPQHQPVANRDGSSFPGLVVSCRVFHYITVAMSLSNKRIAVVGGGLCGMALMNSALQAGLSNIHLYEAASQFAEVGAGVNITRNANRILDAFGIGPDVLLKSSRNPPCYMEYRHYRTGEYLGHIDEFGEPGSRQIHRAHMLEALQKNVPDSSISLGKRLTGISWSTTKTCYELSFLDGTVAEADIVIGCDGIKSVVRQHLGLTDHPVFSGHMVYRGYVSYDDLTPDTAKLLRKTVTFRGLGSHVLTLPIGNDDSNTARVGVIGFMAEPLERWTSEAWLSTAPIEDMHEHVKDWAGPVQEIMDGLRKGSPDGKMLKQALYVREPTPKWFNIQPDHPESGIILIGDSAHSTLPHQGMLHPIPIISRSFQAGKALCLYHNTQVKGHAKPSSRALPWPRLLKTGRERTLRLLSSSSKISESRGQIGSP